MDFIIKVSRNSITLKADPDTIQDLVIILDKLLTVATTMKRKTAVIEARRHRIESKRLSQLQKEADKTNIEIFKRYLLHLNNGCQKDKMKARQAIMEEYRLTATNAKVVIQIGRALSKAEQYKLPL